MIGKKGSKRSLPWTKSRSSRQLPAATSCLDLWAAEKLGKTGQDADDYSKDVVRSDFEEAGDEDVFRKIRSDFDAAGISLPDSEIRSMMEKLLVTAVDQIRTT